MIQEASPSTIDPLADDLRLVADLIRKLPHRPSPAVVSRWVQHGVRGTRLAVVNIAGRNMTTEREFRRFVAAMQSPLPPMEPTGEELDAVDRQLAAKGYK